MLRSSLRYTIALSLLLLVTVIAGLILGWSI